MLINFTSINESTNELMRMSEALEGSSKIAELIRLAASHRLPEFTAEDDKAHENITALAGSRVVGEMQ